VSVESRPRRQWRMRWTYSTIIHDAISNIAACTHAHTQQCHKYYTAFNCPTTVCSETPYVFAYHRRSTNHWTFPTSLQIHSQLMLDLRIPLKSHSSKCPSLFNRHWASNNGSRRTLSTASLLSTLCPEKRPAIYRRDSKRWHCLQRVCLSVCLSVTKPTGDTSCRVDHHVSRWGIWQVLVCLCVLLSQQNLVSITTLQRLEMQTWNLADVKLDPKCRSSSNMDVV